MTISVKTTTLAFMFLPIRPHILLRAEFLIAPNGQLLPTFSKHFSQISGALPERALLSRMDSCGGIPKEDLLASMWRHLATYLAKFCTRMWKWQRQSVLWLQITREYVPSHLKTICFIPYHILKPLIARQWSWIMPPLPNGIRLALRLGLVFGLVLDL